MRKEPGTTCQKLAEDHHGREPVGTYRSMKNCKDLREKLLSSGCGEEGRKKVPFEGQNYEGVFPGKVP